MWLAHVRRRRPLRRRPRRVHSPDVAAGRGDDPQLARRLAGSPRRPLQLARPVCRHRREAQPRGALGHGRRPDSLGEDAALQQPLAERHRPLRVADLERDDLGLAAADGAGPRRPARRAASRRSPAARSTRCGAASSSSSAASAAASAGGGGAVEKTNGRAALTRYSRSSRLGADIGAVGAERLAERADDQVDLAAEPGRGDRAAAARPERPGRVRLVDHQPAAVAAGQLGQACQRRDVAVHREDAVGDDQRPAALVPARGPRRGARRRRGGRRRSRPARAGSRRRCWRGSARRRRRPLRAMPGPRSRRCLRGSRSRTAAPPRSP